MQFYVEKYRIISNLSNFVVGYRVYVHVKMCWKYCFCYYKIGGEIFCCIRFGYRLQFCGYDVVFQGDCINNGFGVVLERRKSITKYETRLTDKLENIISELCDKYGILLILFY